MSDLILHHYPQSPFAEKARLMLGFKGLSWRSVMIPPIMPKPDLTALTGGYRRTPVLQVGADIFCDTAVIARRLDREQSAPALYPEVNEAVAASTAQFADQVLFQHAVAINFQPKGVAARFAGASEAIVNAFIADRKALFTGGSASRLHPSQALSQWPALLGRLERQLGETGSFLMGEEPCIADFSCYHPLWFVASNAAVADALAPYPQVRAWMEAVAACGHGDFSAMESAEAIEAARAAEPESLPEPLTGNGIAGDSADGVAVGQAVTVAAVDYGTDAVAGELVYRDAEEIIIRREDARAGLVHVHFPQFGFRVEKASA